MSDVIDFVSARQARAFERRRLNEPPAAVVLLTQSGKIAAWATGAGAEDDDILFGDEDEVHWLPFSDARMTAARLRRHPAAAAIQLAGFRIEAVRI